MKGLYTFCRLFVAFVLLFYGFAKLNGAQFTILESELDKPMREVSGFWLTWYYFGYSALYGAFVAGVQIIPAIMLLFRRTTLIGSAILFGVIGNIILIDLGTTTKSIETTSLWIQVQAQLASGRRGCSGMHSCSTGNTNFGAIPC